MHVSVFLGSGVNSHNVLLTKQTLFLIIIVGIIILVVESASKGFLETSDRARLF